MHVIQGYKFWRRVYFDSSIFLYQTYPGMLDSSKDVSVFISNTYTERGFVNGITEVLLQCFEWFFHLLLRCNVGIESLVLELAVPNTSL